MKAGSRGAEQSCRGLLWRRGGRAGTVAAMKRDSRIVYSTTDGDLRNARDPKLKERRADASRVRVRREVAGRRGKAVTTVAGVPVDDAGLKEIEIQGDHRDVVLEILRAEGYTPVVAGG
jgi:translation initiation factor 1